MKGGPGDMNLMKVFFPNQGNDIAEVGIKQPTETTEATKTSDLPMQSVMQIEGTGSGIYNFDDHRVPRNNASNFFTGFAMPAIAIKFLFLSYIPILDI